MAVVEVRVPAAAPTRSDRRRVVITSRAGADTFPITSPEVEHGGLAGQWTTVERVYDRPLLHRVGDRLRTMALEVTLVPLAVAGKIPQLGRRVDDLVLVLGSHARLGPCTVAYGALEAGLWELTEITVRTVYRAPGSNDVVQAVGALGFTQASPAPPRPGTVKTSSGTPAPRPSSPSAPAVQPSPRRHTVAAGDTLSGIAQRYYRNAADWPRIAEANGVRDPRRLQVGQVLVIP